jgi:hypothetical protein
MRLLNHAGARLMTLLALTASVTQAKEDALYSHRLTKRGIDADGNYNICKYHISASVYL